MATITKSFSDKVIDGLRKAANELEEFRLQAALGKSEASDKYEDAKKKLNKIIHTVKLKYAEKSKKTDELKAKLEELELQLSLGKADTIDAFKDQKKKLSKTIQRIEEALKKNPNNIKLYSKLQGEIEKFKIKMEILQLRFSLGKHEAQEEFEERKSEFNKKVSEMKEQFSKQKSEKNENWKHFGDEVGAAYSHLKKAFVRA